MSGEHIILPVWYIHTGTTNFSSLCEKMGFDQIYYLLLHGFLILHQRRSFLVCSLHTVNIIHVLLCCYQCPQQYTHVQNIFQIMFILLQSGVKFMYFVKMIHYTIPWQLRCVHLLFMYIEPQLTCQKCMGPQEMKFMIIYIISGHDRFVCLFVVVLCPSNI